MLRKWRRDMKRRLENELGRISVKNGLVVTAVLGSAISVFLYTTPMGERSNQNSTGIVPPTTVTSDKNVNLPTQLTELKMATHDANIEEEFIDKFRPIMAEQPVRDISNQAIVTNTVAAQEESADTPLQQVAPEKAIIGKQEQALLSDEIHDTRVLNVEVSTPTNFVEQKQPDLSASKSIEAREKVIDKKQNEPVAKNADNALMSVEPQVSLPKAAAKDASLTISKQKSKVKTPKVDRAKVANTPIADKAKLIKSTDKPDSVSLVVKEEKKATVNKPVVIIDKIPQARAEIELGHVASSEDTVINQQPTVETKAIESEIIKQSQQQTVIPPVIAQATTNKELNKTSTNKQVAADNSKEDEVLTSDTIILQAVNSSPDRYTLIDRSNGVTSMTMVPKVNGKMPVWSNILSSTDITVFQFKKGQNSYKGTYYLEKSKNGLTMAQRITEEVRQPSLDSTKVQGTYMTMHWKDNPGGDFFIGFNGSALVLYPLDDEAKAIIRDTEAINNRPIVASSIIEAVGNMKINLTQIQSVSIHAE